MNERTHWSEDPYWQEASEIWQRISQSQQKTVEIDLEALQEVVFNGTGPAYRLMEAMVNIHETEGMEGFRGAPRVLLALLAKLSEAGKTST